MRNNTKVIIAIVVVLVVALIVYFGYQKQISNTPQTDEINEIENINDENTEPIPDTTANTETPVAVAKAPSTNTNSDPKPLATNPSIGLLKYKGEFFPFEFSYLNSFRPVQSTTQNTSEYESKSYNFNRLALDGGIAGYVTFYVKAGNDTDYKDLVAEYPDKYSIVKINDYIFYKRVEKETNSSHALRIEYTTFKNGIGYRFSMVVVNGDKKDLDLKTYQNEFDIMEMIIKSLKIS